MARYKLTLAYDGRDFIGSQRQAPSKKRTVQGELESALRNLGWTGRSIILSGRTDTGVHAMGQVAAVDFDWSHTEAELVRALNALLPMDMSVWFAQIMDAKFHPRFDALSRTYQYRLFCHPLRNPLRERYAWRIWSAINSSLFTEVSKLFIGTHDFSAFGSPTTLKGTTVRTVMHSKWTQVSEDEWQFEVQADAFLYHMVRRLVFVQVAVAQGKVPVEVAARSLAKRPSAEKRSGFPSGLAPAHGLTLVKVEYKDKS